VAEDAAQPDSLTERATAGRGGSVVQLFGFDRSRSIEPQRYKGHRGACTQRAVIGYSARYLTDAGRIGNYLGSRKSVSCV